MPKAALRGLCCLSQSANLFPDRQACRLDVTHLPCDQNTNEQEHRKSDAKRKRPGHPTRFGLAIGAIFHHEEQRGGQAGNDG